MWSAPWISPTSGPVSFLFRPWRTSLTPLAFPDDIIIPGEAPLSRPLKCRPGTARIGPMLDKLRAWITANRRTIVLTAEIFWILVFLLDRISNVRSVDIPQFIYVNF